jgi:hypothetical protein
MLSAIITLVYTLLLALVLFPPLILLNQSEKNELTTMGSSKNNIPRHLSILIGTSQRAETLHGYGYQRYFHLAFTFHDQIASFACSVLHLNHQGRAALMAHFIKIFCST